MDTGYSLKKKKMERISDESQQQGGLASKLQDGKVGKARNWANSPGGSHAVVVKPCHFWPTQQPLAGSPALRAIWPLLMGCPLAAATPRPCPLVLSSLQLPPPPLSHFLDPPQPAHLFCSASGSTAALCFTARFLTRHLCAAGVGGTWKAPGASRRTATGGCVP